MAGTLILCSTPIGNLDDVPRRLEQVLKEADVVFAEDTRRSIKLLRHLGVERPLRSYHAGNQKARRRELRSRLEAGETVAFLTDAGTPGISDPGPFAVREAAAVGAKVTVVPGPSAVTAALTVSGFPADRFVFEGFLPRKGKERAARLDAIGVDDRPTVLFSAPTRVGEDLADLAAACGPMRPVVVARELTKLHEEIWRGTLHAATGRWAEGGRGEFTIVVAGRSEAEADAAIDVDAAVDDVAARVEAGSSLGDAVREVAEATGIRRRRLYEAALRRLR